MSTHPIIRQIIDRDCHVSMSTRAVIRHVVSKLRDGYKTFRALPQRERRRFIGDCVKQHQKNARLFSDVMTGRLGGRSNEASDFETLPGEKLSGRELSSLMRKHRVTISSLAFRTGITQKRIRKAREEGLSDPLMVRDWIQAITGKDPGPIPEKYRIKSPAEEAICSYCGGPIFLGESAYLYVNDVFCSRHCCRKSRGFE